MDFVFLLKAKAATQGEVRRRKDGKDWMKVGKKWYPEKKGREILRRMQEKKTLKTRRPKPVEKPAANLTKYDSEKLVERLSLGRYDEAADYWLNSEGSEMSKLASRAADSRGNLILRPEHNLSMWLENMANDGNMGWVERKFKWSEDESAAAIAGYGVATGATDTEELSDYGLFLVYASRVGVSFEKLVDATLKLASAGLSFPVIDLRMAERDPDWVDDADTVERLSNALIDAAKDLQEDSDIYEIENGLIQNNFPDTGPRVKGRRMYQDMAVEVKETAMRYMPVAEGDDSIQYLGGGVNTTSWAILDGDEMVEVVVKPKEGETTFNVNDSHRGFRNKTQYVREAAAYEVDKALGLGMVPPTILRDFPDIGECSIQEFVGDAMDGPTHRTTHGARGDGTINADSEREMEINAGVFDFLLYNVDRHGGNFLYSDRKLTLIDHGISMFDEGKTMSAEALNYSYFLNMHEGKEIPENTMEALRNMDMGAIRHRLGSMGLTMGEVQSFEDRKAYIEATGRLPEAPEYREKRWVKR